MSAGSPRRTAAVAARLVAALLGGYALVRTWTAGVALALPMPAADAVLASAMLSFPLYVAVLLWVLVTRRPARTAGLLAAATLVALLPRLGGAP